FFAAIPLDEGVWTALKAFRDTSEARALSPVHQHFLKKTIDDFKRHGAELGAKGKQRLGELTRELSEVTTRFAQNVLDATAAFELVVDDPSRLAGLPES